MSSDRARSAALDALNFLLADVRGALGPFLNVFLVTQQHWTQSRVGMVATVSGLIGLVAQTPAGAMIDATRAKRAYVAIALVILAGANAVIFATPRFGPVLAASTAMAVLGDIFGPAVAALTLGLFAKQQLARRMGRNAAFDHAGNVFIASIAAYVGFRFGQRAVFLVGSVFALAAIGAVLAVPGAAIDHERARGADGERSQAPLSSWRSITGDRSLMILALSTLLFHFANAPLLPLVGQKLAAQNGAFATPLMASCIIAAQLVMLPIAVFTGRRADRYGRKPILLAGFAILPIRALLYTFSDRSAWLIGVQLLDGIGAGILGALTPLVVADLMRGSGRYNLALGVIATAQGVGASLSGLAAGLSVDHWGYQTTFLGCGAAAVPALLALAFAFPETRQDAGIRPTQLVSSGLS